jgi:hypothetical protein
VVAPVHRLVYGTLLHSVEDSLGDDEVVDAPADPLLLRVEPVRVVGVGALLLGVQPPVDVDERAGLQQLREVLPLLV